MMEMVLLLDRIGSSAMAHSLFEEGTEPSEKDLNRVRRFLEEAFWEHTVQFVPRDFVGYYGADRTARVFSGLWPVNWREAAFLLLYVSTAVFDSPDEESAISWVRNVGRYSHHVEDGEWEDACAYIERFVRKALVA